MEKQYGKLTAPQFTELIGFIPDLLKIISDANELVASISAAKFDEALTGDYGNYCHIYERPFQEHLALVCVAVGFQDQLHSMATSPDPQEAVLDVLRHMEESGDDGDWNPAMEPGQWLPFILAFGRTITSMTVYGRSISGLLEDVRERNDQEALFKAIRMDRAVIGCPTAMRLISRAQLRDNKAFFKRLRSALAGPGKKQWEGREPLRYAFILLNEMGTNLTEAKLETLMVDVLKAYPRNPSARKNLRAQYQQFRKYKTI